MAVTVTNSLISALNTEQTFTANAATSTTINETEVFTITPTNKDHKMAIFFSNGSGHGAVTYSIAKGAGVFQAPAAKTGSIAAGAIEVIQIESGKYLSSSGTIVITMTPATGKRLLTDHAFSMYELELI
jgi:hypothetical protein